MFTVATYSLASLSVMLSGLYPSKNGINAYYNMFKFKKDKCKTIAQYLKEGGYYTVTDVIGDYVIPLQGFEKKSFHKNEYDFIERHTNIIEDTAQKAKKIGKKFFLYFQYNGIHRNEIKNVGKKYGDFDEKYFSDINENKKKYLSAVLECNKYVKAVMETLKKLNLIDNTIIIFHSDHGTSIGERKGEKMYGVFLYDYTLKIFSLFLIPDKEPKEITKTCVNLDIIPTIMELTGIKENLDFEKMDGKSLLSLENEKDERIVFSETGGLGGPWPSPKKHNVFSVRYKNKKIIYNKTPNTWEFYDLEKDPNEDNNLINSNFPEIEKYRKILLGKLSENKIIIN